ncbi:hypothetical protein C5Z06_15590 [Enterocloster bolteae]|nr:hypothetical protein C5Z06_15590 [Enterocloster bolteae]
MLQHCNSLSNKMDNSLLAVRDINHKYIVVGKGQPYKKTAGPCNTGISCRLWRAGHLPLPYPPILTLKPILSLNQFLGPLPLLCCLFSALLLIPCAVTDSLLCCRCPKTFHHLIHIRLLNHQRRNETDDIGPGAD